MSVCTSSPRAIIGGGAALCARRAAIRRTVRFFFLALHGARLQRVAASARRFVRACLGAHHSGSVSECASSQSRQLRQRCVVGWPLARRDFACACAHSQTLTTQLDTSALVALARAARRSLLVGKAEAWRALGGNAKARAGGLYISH